MVEGSAARPNNPRYAIYLTPARDSVLAARFSSWLGRDPWSDNPVPLPSSLTEKVPGLIDITSNARQYGAHATIVAPFELAEDHSRAALCDAMDAFAGGRASVTTSLIVSSMMRFVALTAPDRSALSDLASDVVRAFSQFRAPLSAYDYTRRHYSFLSERQKTNLDTWGYPFVMEDFIFHMTLSGALDEEGGISALAAAQDWFADALSEPICFDGLALFRQPDRDSTFSVDHYALFEKS